jgi:ribosomal protein S27AE
LIKFLPNTLLLLALLGVYAGAVEPEPPTFYNGFEVEGGLIAPNEIDHGGPGRDGIPALDAPRFLAGTERKDSIKPGDRVMGVSYNGVAKAYPIAILDYHEIVNDSFGDIALTVTFCPLCGTGMVFLANAGDQVLNFGVSGLIYNSDMLLYDRNTQSLWSQVMKTAVTGPLKGTTLTQVPAQYTTWASWSQQHPDSLLLSRDTGHLRDYDNGPYAEYKRLPGVYFATLHSDWRLPAKTWVVGVTAGNEALALPFEELDKLQGVLAIAVGGQELEIRWDKAASAARAFDTDGREYPTTSGYWFAWVAFHPATGLYLAEPDG